jgi:hypothetical protein
MVVHVTASDVTLLFIPYGTRKILVLVIGRIELITITENHVFGIISIIKNKKNKIVVKLGVITAVKKNMFLTHSQ